ncbi:MAG: 5-(carboxyamino)imidazole ribonucleotide synthase [Gammaproteobacteria bacterium]|nr:5-(carboxyamino)imidazole ribonucleotide synthase [Gammaproteobacteria bacterium]
MTIGIVGAGQLGRMLALAGYPLGLDFLFLDRSADVPAAVLAPVVAGEFTDRALLRRLARRCEVLSFDWENISVSALRVATRGLRTRLSPPLRALATGQDRLAEKRLFERLRIPTTRYATVGSRAALERACAQIGLPGVLKTRRLGYDGKGQALVRRRADIGAAWEALGGVPLLYEEFIDFELEVSALGTRALDGSEALYPLTRNWHAGGMLRLSVAPWEAPGLERQARAHLRAVLRDFSYVGTLALEFFVRRGRLIANELAPRVHNSGHWTIEGAVTSQFENHLRAIAGLPLGRTAATGHAAMVNLIGRMPSAAAVLAQPGVHLHDYGKSERPGRKLGHCTLVAASAAERDRRARKLLRALAQSLSPAQAQAGAP